VMNLPRRAPKTPRAALLRGLFRSARRAMLNGVLAIGVLNGRKVACRFSYRDSDVAPFVGRPVGGLHD
jgi:hypothetical protein